MKKLYYDKKLYKDIDDATAQQIGLQLVSSPRPYHIMVDGEALKASLIEIRTDDPPPRRSEQKVPLEDIQKFQRAFERWQEQVPPEERSMEFYASVHGLIELRDIYVAPSGLKRVTNFSVIDPVRFTKFSKQYAAMQEHYAKVDWAKRKELQEQEAKMFP